MRRRTRLYYIAALTLAAAAACGGLSPERESGNVDPAVGAAGSSGGAGSLDTSASRATAGAGATTTGTPDPTPASSVPQKHRALATTCDHQRPAGNARPYGEPSPCPQDGGSCELREDCPTCRAACIDYEDGLGPQCVSGSGECLSDADCTAKDNGRCWENRGDWFCTYDTCYSDATCSSGGPCACEGESGSPGNTCLPGNCQKDTDCGGNGYCSPTFGTCGDYGGVVAYYCHTAADTCLDDADCRQGGAGYCMYSPEVGHWSCGYARCVG
ncbi:MAG: hypothetical protein ABI895_16960 [Deltaproteobacteria bacterium]